MNFLSPDSKCYSFDHRANGYSRGEGTAVVVLKLLSQAVKDSDLIRGVIRATGINQDGRTPGITQPNSDAQEAMISQTYESANLNLSCTHFFEAHGTGTTIGDRMEATAIANVFQKHGDSAVPLRIGAVKSNIGHLEGAAGLAGLIKSVLILEKGIIPPNVWFEKSGPSIDTQAWNIKVRLIRSLRTMLTVPSFRSRASLGPLAAYVELRSTPLAMEDPMHMLYLTMLFTSSKLVVLMASTALVFHPWQL